MRQRVGMLVTTLLMAVSLVAIVPAPAGAAANEVLANWQMNEGNNADVMFDSSGNGIHGAIGDAVDTGENFGGGTVGYHWSYVSPTAPPAKPERLVVIDDDRLNPGSDDYAITMRFRTDRPFGNMIQKGQSGQVGGMWKWQMPSGQLVCLFRGVGPQGQQYEEVVNSGANLPRLDDGRWHTARCERRQDQLILTIDEGTPNERVRRANGPTGNISNPIPVTIAGKLNCNQQTITCDYFVGDIDYVIIETSSRNDAPTANASGSCDFLDCSFFANGSFDPDGTIVNYHWDFGDGTETDGFAPTHTYASPGTYEATLTVTDDQGATDSDSVTVVATSEPPTAVASADCTHLECSFTASGSFDPDGSIVSYEWDFGDGSDAEGFSPTYGYSTAGSYPVTLTVTDNHGATDDAELVVDVVEAKPVYLRNLVPRPFDKVGDRWIARAVIVVRDTDGARPEGVEVTVRIGSMKRTCVTGPNGKCRVKRQVPDVTSRVRLTVIDVDWIGGYDPAANKDQDGDGNTETVPIIRPF